MRNQRIQEYVDPGWSVTIEHAHANVNVKFSEKWIYEDWWIPILKVKIRATHPHS